MDRLRDSYRSKGSEIEVNEQVSVISPLLHTVQWKGLLDLSGSRDEDGICHWGFRPVGFRCSFFFNLAWSGIQPCVTAAINRGPLLKDRMADPGPGNAND